MLVGLYIHADMEWVPWDHFNDLIFVLLGVDVSALFRDIEKIFELKNVLDCSKLICE